MQLNETVLTHAHYCTVRFFSKYIEHSKHATTCVNVAQSWSNVPLHLLLRNGSAWYKMKTAPGIIHINHKERLSSCEHDESFINHPPTDQAARTQINVWHTTMLSMLVSKILTVDHLLLDKRPQSYIHSFTLVEIHGEFRDLCMVC